MANDRMSPISDEQIAAEEALATRYVLGELSEEEFADFEARYASDAGFRDRYNRWAAALGEEPAESGTEPDKSGPFGLMDVIGRLGVVPAVIGALIAALLVALVTNMGMLNGEDGGASTQTGLASEDGTLVAEARFDPEGPALGIRLMEIVAEPGMAFEVWLVEGDGVPRSLGLIPAAASRGDLPLSAEQAAALYGGAIVITREPEGGAGAAGPTGPVVAAGAFAAP